MIYISDDFKYPLTVRLDFHRAKILPKAQISTLTTRFPVLIFPQIYHLTYLDIFKEKIEAILTRSKGRDIFDIWFLILKGIKSERIAKKFLNRIENFSQAKLRTDLEKFLPKEQRSIIPNLKKEIFWVCKKNLGNP